jgi:hypothetical protein
LKSRFHRSITCEALASEFGSLVLETIVSANLFQDRLRGQIGHPYFHFDSNSFQLAYRYMDEQRAIIYSTISQNMDPTPAWEALGRLTHTAQDFYAHSNYIQLWLESQPKDRQPTPEEIDPLCEVILRSPQLHSGRIYLPLDLLSLFPGMDRWIKPFIPRDSHAWMNLDGPECGPLFPYALAAAKMRTRYEVEQVIGRIQAKLDSGAVARFRALDATM